MLLIVFCFGRGIRAAPRLWLWEEDPCFSSFFVLGGGSVLLFVFVLEGETVLLIVFCFGSMIRVDLVFFVLGGDPCCSSFFDLRGGSVLLMVFFGFGMGIRVAHHFFGEGVPCCSSFSFW